MFTREQIEDIHDRYGKASTLTAYLDALRAIGVETSDSYITDGHTVYYGQDGHTITTDPAHEPFAVAGTSDKDQFMQTLELAKQGKTSYVEMSQGLAASGIEKWTFDTNAMTLSYYDKAGNKLLVETIT